MKSPEAARSSRKDMKAALERKIPEHAVPIWELKFHA